MLKHTVFIEMFVEGWVPCQHGLFLCVRAYFNRSYAHTAHVLLFLHIGMPTDIYFSLATYKYTHTHTVLGVVGGRGGGAPLPFSYPPPPLCTRDTCFGMYSPPRIRLAFFVKYVRRYVQTDDDKHHHCCCCCAPRRTMLSPREIPMMM